MEQKERDVIMREFRSGSSRVLITTDLLVSDGPDKSLNFLPKVYYFATVLKMAKQFHFGEIKVCAPQ